MTPSINDLILGGYKMHNMSNKYFLIKNQLHIKVKISVKTISIFHLCYFLFFLCRGGYLFFKTPPPKKPNVIDLSHYSIQV
jgi:hypothetical protein